MENAIFCLVDGQGRTYVKDGARSYAEVAAAFGLAEDECDEYRFDLEARRVLKDRATLMSELTARAYAVAQVGTPERLMAFAGAGHLPKQALVNLLRVDQRDGYLKACAGLERRYTEACRAENDPCLASGCAAEGEICLQPLLGADVDYARDCAAEWVRLFRNPSNRIDVWKN